MGAFNICNALLTWCTLSKDPLFSPPHRANALIIFPIFPWIITQEFQNKIKNVHLIKVVVIIRVSCDGYSSLWSSTNMYNIYFIIIYCNIIYNLSLCFFVYFSKIKIAVLTIVVFTHYTFEWKTGSLETLTPPGCQFCYSLWWCVYLAWWLYCMKEYHLTCNENIPRFDTKN